MSDDDRAIIDAGRGHLLTDPHSAAQPEPPSLMRRYETLRIEVARWGNERRGQRQSDLLAIYERRIFAALDAIGHWRERD